MRLDPRDERGLLLGMLIRVVVVLAVLAVVMFDGGSVIFNRLAVAQAVEEAVDRAGLVFAETGSTAKARAEAERVAEEAGARVTKVTIDREDRLITVALEKQARTLVLGRFEATRSWTVAVASRKERIP